MALYRLQSPIVWWWQRQRGGTCGGGRCGCHGRGRPRPSRCCWGWAAPRARNRPPPARSSSGKARGHDQRRWRRLQHGGKAGQRRRRQHGSGSSRVSRRTGSRRAAKSRSRSAASVQIPSDALVLVCFRWKRIGERQDRFTTARPTHLDLTDAGRSAEDHRGRAAEFAQSSAALWRRRRVCRTLSRAARRRAHSRARQGSRRQPAGGGRRVAPDRRQQSVLGRM